MPGMISYASVRKNIRNDSTARIDALADSMSVIAGDDDRISPLVDAADDADMSAILATRQHRDGADLRTGYAPAVRCERFRSIRAGTFVAAAFKHEIHETRAPQGVSVGRIGANPAPCFGNR